MGVLAYIGSKGKAGALGSGLVAPAGGPRRTLLLCPTDHIPSAKGMGISPAATVGELRKQPPLCALGSNGSEHCGEWSIELISQHGHVRDRIGIYSWRLLLIFFS